MYKNLTYLNKTKSVKKYEQELLFTDIFKDKIKTKDTLREVSYITPDVLITINKNTVNFLVFDSKNTEIIYEIEMFQHRFRNIRRFHIFS